MLDYALSPRRNALHNFIADFRVPVYLYVVVLPVEFGVGFRAGCRVEHGCVAQ